MGSWGYKVGESDSVLDNIDKMLFDTDYLVKCLTPGFNVVDTDQMLLAIALVDASFNGYCESIFNLSEEYKIKINQLSPILDGLCSAIIALNLVKGYENGCWFYENNWIKRQEIFNLIEIRLRKTFNSLIKYARKIKEV